MTQTVLITLTLAGTDTGPFDLYSNVDGYLSPFETGVTKASLISGYLSTLVPDVATTIRVKSVSVLCTNYVDLTIVATTTTSTSTSSTSSTTTSSTTTTSTTSTTTTEAITLTILNNYDGTDSVINSITIPTATVTPVSGAFPLAFGESFVGTVSPMSTLSMQVSLGGSNLGVELANFFCSSSTEICQNVTAPGTYTFTNIDFSMNVVGVYGDGSCA